MSMDKKRIELIVTSVLVLIFIAAWANSFKVLKQKLRAKARAPAAPAALPLSPAAVPLPQEQVQGNSAAREKDDGVWVRDPFSGKTYSRLGDGGYVPLELSGILWDPKTPTALIDGQVVKEGDTVGTFRVIRIEKEAVILSDGTKEVDLRL